jgi:hypothetical protein
MISIDAGLCVVPWEMLIECMHMPLPESGDAQLTAAQDLASDETHHENAQRSLSSCLRMMECQKELNPRLPGRPCPQSRPARDRQYILRTAIPISPAPCFVGRTEL